MKSNIEVKIAIVVAAIMITFCLVIFIVKKAEEPNYNNVELHVYKINEEDNKYYECSIVTDDIQNMYKDFENILSLPDSRKVTGGQINGTYRVDSNNSFIAFDADDSNYVYRGDTTAVYKFNSSLYKYVVDLCNNTD